MTNTLRTFIIKTKLLKSVTFMKEESLLKNFRKSGTHHIQGEHFTKII